MEYSGRTAISRGLAVICPTQPLIASANGNVLQIHNGLTTTLVESITTAGPITSLTWTSGTPALLAAGSSPGGNVVVVNADGDVIADIHDGRLEIAWLVLCNQGRLVIGYEHAIGVAIFDLHRGRLLSFVPNATRASKDVSVASRCVSPCDRYIALAVHTSAWQHSITVVSTLDGSVLMTARHAGDIARIATIRWLAPTTLLVTGRHDTSVYATASILLTVRGDALPHALHGRMDVVPIRQLAQHPNSALAALGCDHGRVRLLDTARRRLLCELRHALPRADADADADAPPLVFRERRTDTRAAFDVVRSADYLPLGRASRSDGTSALPHGADGRPRNDVRWLAFSPDGAFLACRCEGAANVLLIWDVCALRVAIVLVLRDAIVAARWNSSSAGKGKGGGDNDGEGEDEDDGKDKGGRMPTLAVACGGPWIYLWQSHGAAAVHIGGSSRSDGEFNVRKVAWAHDDSFLLLVDGVSSRSFMTAFLPAQVW